MLIGFVEADHLVFVFIVAGFVLGDGVVFPVDVVGIVETLDHVVFELAGVLVVDVQRTGAEGVFRADGAAFGVEKKYGVSPRYVRCGPDFFKTYI